MTDYLDIFADVDKMVVLGNSIGRQLEVRSCETHVIEHQAL